MFEFFYGCYRSTIAVSFCIITLIFQPEGIPYNAAITTLIDLRGTASNTTTETTCLYFCSACYFLFKKNWKNEKET